MKVREAIEQFELACKADGLADTTVKWYQSLLKPFAASHGDTNLQDVSPRMMREYIVALREQESRFSDAPQRPEIEGGLSRTTLRSHVTALKRFWTWAYVEYELSANPMAHIRKQKASSPQPKQVSRNDFVRLFDAATGIRDKALLATLADTGARISGVLSMTVTETNLELRRAHVTEKGDKRHTVYFTHYTGLLIEKWLQQRESSSNALWTSLSTGEPLTTSGAHQRLKVLRRKADVRGHVTFHRFRHTFAREYIRSGGDISTLARLLGHADVQTTHQYYAVFSPDELQVMHDKHISFEEWLQDD